MFADLRQQLAQRFAALAPREQILTLAGGTVAILYLVIALGWEPLATERERLHSDNKNLQADLAALRQTVSNWQELAKGSSIDTEISPQDLNRRIEQSVKRNNLRIKRFQPDKSGDIGIWLEKANFANASTWIVDLEERLGLHIQSAKISSKKGPGQVELQLKLKAPGLSVAEDG